MESSLAIPVDRFIYSVAIMVRRDGDMCCLSSTSHAKVSLLFSLSLSVTPSLTHVNHAGDCWLNDLWKYDIETQHWTCIQESSGPSSAAAVGATSNNNNNNDSSEELTLLNANNGIAQPAVQGKVPTRRFGYVSVVHNGKFVLFGGFDVRVHNNKCIDSIDAHHTSHTGTI